MRTTGNTVFIEGIINVIHRKLYLQENKSFFEVEITKNAVFILLVAFRIRLGKKQIKKGGLSMKKAKKTYLSLTSRDMDILNALWESEEPMTASMIVQSISGITMNTVQAVLRKLLKNHLIEVADIVYSGTVLSRCYRTTITEEEFLLDKMTYEYQSVNKKVSKTSIFAALIADEDNPERLQQDISQMQAFLDEYKKKG